MGGAKKGWWEAGRQGLPFDWNAYWGAPDSWGKDALEIGSVVHQWIEDDLHETPLTEYPDLPADALEQAQTGWKAYRQWRDQAQIEVVVTELPLVSELYSYGGTLDAVAHIGEGAALLDWKTSNATYQDYIAQLAAYRQLWNENHPYNYDLEDAYLLRVGKEFGDFHVHYWPSNVLDLGWKWFLAAKELYELDKQLKKVAA